MARSREQHIEDLTKIYNREPTDEEVDRFIVAEIEQDMKIAEFLTEASENDIVVSVMDGESVFINSVLVYDVIRVWTEFINDNPQGHEPEILVTLRNLIVASMRNVGVEEI